MATNQLTVKLTGPKSQDGFVDFWQFTDFCQSVAKCLRRAEHIVTGTDSRIHYKITGLECASAKVKMQAMRPTKGADDRRKVLSFFNTAVSTIQRGKPDPRLGPDDLQDFAALANPLDHGLLATVGRTKITKRFKENIKTQEPMNAVSEGFVTGILDKLDLHNKTEIVIFPPLGDKIACKFSEDMLAQIRAALKRNVTVRGKLHYRSGRLLPHRVEATSMRIHEQDADLPTLHDVRAFGPWDTGGLDAVEFVRSIRDEQN